MTSKDSLFHDHHPNFYDYFPRAIAPFKKNNLEALRVFYPSFQSDDEVAEMWVLGTLDRM